MSVTRTLFGRSFVLAFLAASAALTSVLYVWRTPAQANSHASCPEECVCGWVNSIDQLGGIECEHGPETDDDCGCPDLPLITIDDFTNWAVCKLMCCEQRDQDMPERRLFTFLYI